jgi:hypothetical protein
VLVNAFAFLLKSKKLIQKALSSEAITFLKDSNNG